MARAFGPGPAVHDEVLHAHPRCELTQAQGQRQAVVLTRQFIGQMLQGRGLAATRISQQDDAGVFVDAFAQGVRALSA